MAAGLSGSTMASFAVKNPLLAAAARFRTLPSRAGRPLPFSPFTRTARRRGQETVTCFVPQEGQAPGPAPEPVPSLEEEAASAAARRVAERKARKQSERRTYLVAAVMSSLGVTSMAIASVYYRFAWQMEGGEVPMTEMLGTFALSVGAAVGMEFWAQWAHKALWHASLWHMHESHHRPRDGPFELNDVFAIINAGPAIALLAYGFFHRGLIPGLGLRFSGWHTCSSTTAWSTAGSPSAPSRTCPTSGEWLPLTRYTTWTSSRGYRMGFSWDPRSWRTLVASTNWSRSSPGSTGLGASEGLWTWWHTQLEEPCDLI
ncbi:unnamed protein product [Triticum aestivum]|uniref:beta-carotene 3-hydroxylase n=1 Tax=Triticum aestivum TaxID=4565 RepID=A0A7H4LL55_WHEAT|nr:unnamed protein product [Triticum aestivum]